MVNSNQKGKKGEREACKFLRSIGFPDARRTAQYKGSFNSGDIECPKSLFNIHIEVKFGSPKINVSSSILHDACEQAFKDAAWHPWVVLWKPKSSQQWRLTCKIPGLPGCWTTGDVEAIKAYLIKANKSQEVGGLKT